MGLRKTLVVAAREYQTSVKSKAFVISLVVMPILMGGGIVAQVLLKDTGDISPRKLGVVDRTGKLFDALAAAAEARNELEIFRATGEAGKQTQPRYVVERVDPAAIGEPPQSTLKLSDRVRTKELFAFVEIGPDAIGPANISPDDPQRSKIAYHSDSPTYDDLRNWLTGVLNTQIQLLRLRAAGIDPAAVQEATRRVPVDNLGLVSAGLSGGQVSQAERINEAAHILVPMAFMMLLFMAVMVGASPLVQSVLEEKMARIAEVLLGSVSPFQLIMGKLIGTVGVSLTMVGVYLAGGYCALYYAGYAHFFPTHLLIWFFVFLALAVLMYGSLFAAVGAAVTDLKEAQSTMMPVMIVAMFPMFLWLNVVRAPTATFSVVLSLFPPATPMLMIMRQAVPPGVPLWQPLLGVVLVLLATVACVYAAGRIFRVGLLMQGKGANFTQMAKWVLRG
jgi:ABC-2 type transport system permease protein